jgi:hypothetical protein
MAVAFSARLVLGLFPGMQLPPASTNGSPPSATEVKCEPEAPPEEERPR